VKGCCHEESRVVAMPRLVGGRKYKDYRSAYNVVRNSYRHYLSKPLFTAREIPMVLVSDIKTVIPPYRMPRCYDNTALSTAAREIIEILEKHVGGEWMITGSLLYCAVDERSDIDGISYSARPEHLKRLESLISEGVFRKPTLREAIAEAQEDLEGMGLRTRVLQIMRGMSSLYYKDYRVTIKIVRCDRKEILGICSEKLSSRRYAAILEIEDSSEGSLFPYIYIVRIARAYSGDIYEGERLIAYSHRSRYASIEEGSRLACTGIIEEGLNGEKYINLDQGFCSFWD